MNYFCRDSSYKEFTIDPRRPLKWNFFRLFHACDKRWLWDDEFMIEWWVNLCWRGSWFTVCLQVCWVSHFLTRCNPRYVTEKSSTDAKSITYMYIRFASNLDLLSNLQMLLCYKLWRSMPRNVYHHFFLNHVDETNSVWNGLKKKPYKGHLRSIVSSICTL